MKMENHLATGSNKFIVNGDDSLREKTLVKKERFFFLEEKRQALGCDWKILDVSCKVVVGRSRKVRKAWSKRRKELIASRSSVKKNWSGSSDFHLKTVTPRTNISRLKVEDDFSSSLGGICYFSGYEKCDHLL